MVPKPRQVSNINCLRALIFFFFTNLLKKSNLYYVDGYRLPNGKIPTVAEYKANPHAVTADNDITALATEVNAGLSEFSMDRWAKLMGSDLYAAHAKAIEEGYEDWSEWGWLHNKMGLSLNATNFATGLAPGNIWNTMYDSFTFGRATNWRTVQGGLNRIAEAFGPVVGKKVQFGVQVSKLAFDEDNNQVSVQWKKDVYDTKYESKSYDHVIVSAPFSVVRNWHLPKLDYMLNEAIHNLPYKPSCKVALEFKKRFWEHLDQPIEGGCDSTDLWSGTICYPANNIGSNGTGVVLASYVSGRKGQDCSAMKEEEHVARVLDDFRELHGDELIDTYYTGKYDRVCWSLDHLQGGGMAQADAGQHKLYMPSYFKISQGLVFVGEHTDIKHAWISAALESAIRGVVMILVENGHVDEAKAIVTKYNAKWMKI